MGRFGLRQTGERRVAALLRLALAVLLLVLQVGLIVFLAYLLKQYAAIVYALLQISGLAAAVNIYNRRGDAMYKTTWIILILTVPVVGLILFLLWGYGAEQRRLRRMLLTQGNTSKTLQTSSVYHAERLAHDLPAWERLTNSLLGRGFALHGNTVATYFSEGQEFLEDLFDKCAHAQRFIFLEYFILAEGTLWERLSAILCERARTGVEVRIIFDDFGNLRRFRGSSVRALREAGAEVVAFNPVHRYVNRLYFNYRDHRKLACVDGGYAWTGGINLADEYANLIVRFGYWKDSGVRLEGEGAWGLTAAFLSMWRVLTGDEGRTRDFYRPQGNPHADGWCQIVTDGPLNNPDNPVEDVYLQLIAGARRSLFITTPYFIPDAETMRALCIAGNGGVDVRLMLPRIPDHYYTDLVAESYFGELLEHGVKIYRYTPGFLHQKVILADDEVAMIGSVNVDYRSFQLHFECGALLYGAAIPKNVRADLEQIIAQSHAVTQEEWRRRKWYRRVMEPLMRMFAIWM